MFSWFTDTRIGSMTSFSSLLANHNPMKDLELPNCPDDSISMIKFSPNANYLLCGSWDNTARCWEVAETGPGLKAQISHDAPVLSCCWHSVCVRMYLIGNIMTLFTSRMEPKLSRLVVTTTLRYGISFPIKP